MSEKFEIETDSLTELERKFHQVLMVNELFAGKGAYELQHAKLGQSGYSFGPIQWDLSQRTEARRNFKRILLTVGSFSKNELGEIMSKVKRSGAKLNKEQIKKINEALSSPRGKQIIEELYLKELKKNINRIEEVIEEVAKAEYRDFLDSTVAKLFLLDYHNQFDISSGGEMEKFLAGEEVTIGKGRRVQVEESLGLGDLLNFYFNTYYGQKQPQDLIRRFNNVLAQVEVENLKLAEDDFKQIARVLSDQRELIFAAGTERALASLMRRATRWA
ncbi:hypothetical protein [Fuchsiella alkaliacetigena]|uniref:hypothetical protein n=1 Tax=Fuchsiella alkaliacetigena TaxID=957042 RepID=UPI00200B3290|nr:hypothetical protein [Fuchsiella alkaliacetigena]MCK8823973.1 hypothetical protein [Fuchsiella alkaliacetigena]